ncbi:MAG: MlaD family protein [Candidatus Dormibacteraceae bacterium]
MMAVLAMAGKAKIAIAMAAVVIVGILAYRGLAAGADPYTLTAPVANAAGLYPGSDVLVAGVRVGTVQNITLTPSTALVTFSVDSLHSPVSSNATVYVRPKSLLGEEYLDLNPGSSAGVLTSGTTLPAAQVNRSVELQDVINSLDAKTRDKLQVLIYNLGGGLAGRGPETNQTLQQGRKDLDDLARISATLAAQDSGLRQVVTALSQVTGKLAQNQNRSNLGALIKNGQTLLTSLNRQDAQLQADLTVTNAALQKSGTALDGTSGSVSSIARQIPTTLSLLTSLTHDLGTGLDYLLATGPYGSGTLLQQQLQAIKAGPIVFGGRDANGYATRIDIILGASTPAKNGSSPASAPGGSVAPGGLPGLPGLPGTPRGAGTGSPSAASGLFQFLTAGGTRG